MGEKHLRFHKKIPPISVDCKCGGGDDNVDWGCLDKAGGPEADSDVMGKFDHGYFSFVGVGHLAADIQAVGQTSPQTGRLHNIENNV